MAITSIGVGSGIDLEGLVTDLIAAEREPQEIRLNLKETLATASISALGNLKSTVSAFQTSLENLQNSDFYGGRTGTSGDSDLFTVTADSSASLGSYTIEVNKLASANKIATNGAFANPNAIIGEGAVTIGFVGGNTFEISVAATDNLTALRDAINDAPDNVGVTASLITAASGTELVITANDTGVANQLDISVVDIDGQNQDANGLSRLFYNGSDPDNSLNGLNQTQQINAAQDAQIFVDGFAATSSSNEFTGVLEGLTITALADDGGELILPSASLVVSTDKASIKSDINTFVGSYNELITVLNSLTDYDQATGTRGLLGADATISTLENQIRRIVTDTVDSADGSLDNLALLGITTNRNGSVALNEATLDDAISNNFDNIGALMGGDDGVASRLDELLESFLKFDGLFATKENTLNTQLNEIADQRSTLELRLTAIEERFRSQFAALDILVSRLNSTGNFLTQQLDAAAKIVNRDNS
ncbi:MAG: flagellar filament capping protein FliD [Oceanicoccus sp.]